MRSWKWWGPLLVVLVVLVGADTAFAQRRGGSFGGGSFGRSGSSSGSRSTSSGSRWGSGSRSTGSRATGSRSTGSRWGSSSRRSSSSGGTYGAGSRRRGGGCGFGSLGGLGCCFLFFGGIVVLVLLSRFAKGKKGGGASGPSAYHGPDAMWVTRLSLGIDWRARREVQATLQRLAETGDTTSPEGLANLLREAVLSLRRAELSWLYVSQAEHGPLSPQGAEQQFNQIATSARSAFQTEMVRGAGGQVHLNEGAPEMQANKNDGEGTVVVHLIIASYRALRSMQNPDANQIRAALDDRSSLTSQQLGALEVVWSPADENDRMSTAELEQFYPELRLIDPSSIAGRLFCTYCRGPFAMELLNCPHCGAPAEASRDNRAPPGA